MPDDPLDQLTHLAPAVDAPRALHALAVEAGRRRRRRRVAGALGVLVTLVIGAGALRAQLGADDESVVANDVTSWAPVTATTTVGDLELTVTVPDGHLVLGEVTEVEVLVRNVGTADVTLSNFDHCEGPGRIDEPELWPEAKTEEEAAASVWDGVSSLAAHIAVQNTLGPPTLQHREAIGQQQACFSNIVYTVVAPADELRWSGVIETVIGPTEAGPRLRLAASADTRSGPVEVVAELPVEDPPERLRSADAAVAALGSDPRVATFLDRVDPTRELTVVDFDQRADLDGWRTTLVWRSGRWELTMQHWRLGDSLRLQYEPTERAVVDARIMTPRDDGPGYDEEVFDLP